MPRKKSVSPILAISLLLLLGGRGTAEAGRSPDIAYRAGSGPVVLSGPWERFDGLLGEESLGRAASQELAFPLRSRPPSVETPGPATYRTMLRLEAQAGSATRYALYIPAFSGLVAAYVNGQLLYSGGRDPAMPPLLLFDAPKAEASILLQVGSAGSRLEEPSLLPSFVAFGEAEAMSRMSLLMAVLAAFQDGFFLILGLFVLLLFFFWKKNLDFLAFALFLIASGLFYLFKEGALFLRFPIGGSRIDLETACLVANDFQLMALTFILRSAYRDRLGFWAVSLPYGLPLAHAAATLLLPSSFIALAAVGTVYFEVFALAALGFSSYLAIRGNRPALWLTAAFAFVAAGLAIERLGPESIWSAYLAEPAGFLLFGLTMMLMIVRKVSGSFKATESLSDYVETVSHAVKSFIPKEFLEHLEKSDFIDLRLGDHTKKEMTIFFSDIRGFTALSERLTVEENFAFINSYLSRVVPIIRENGGFVDKYIGDAIMALYPSKRGPDEAIRSAIAMQVKMVEYNGHRAKMGYKPISMGVGIHTGDLMLGVVGVADRMENTVISDAVNLSSRLQAITKAFNIGTAISEQSFKELEDPGSYKYRFIGKVKVKGKDAPVSVFEIFDGIEPDLFERKMKANMFFEQGMLSYYQKDFAAAMYYFKRVLEIIPEDGAAGFYLDNCMNKAAL